MSATTWEIDWDYDGWYAVERDAYGREVCRRRFLTRDRCETFINWQKVRK